MKIKSIQVGQPQTYHDFDAADGRGGEWTTAIFKTPIVGPVRAAELGLDGDGQADTRHHGGPDKAINAYCLAHYPYWTAELKQDAMPFGSFGENLTLDGAVEADVCVGDVYEAGGAVLQISQPRQPCGTLARRWGRPDLVRHIERNGMTGWYFRVLKAGELRAGDELKLIERPFPLWTITAANEVMHHRRTDYAAARELAAVGPLAASWKEALVRRSTGK